VSYHLTSDALKKVAAAIASAIPTFNPKVSLEMLETPEGSALHVKLVVDRLKDEATRRAVIDATSTAIVSTLPDLEEFPHVTLFQRA
jgi:hypothetical protein